MDRHTSAEGRQGLSFGQQLVSSALGLAGGLAVNALSTDVGYHGAVAAAAFAAILLSTNWLRQLPPRAPLVRIVSWALLGGAAIMVLAAATNPRWEALATIVATVLTTSAVLIQTDLDKAGALLGGVALIGLGVAYIGVGVVVLRNWDALSGIALISAAAADIGVGVGVLRHADVLFGVGLIGLGVGLVGLGVGTLRHGDEYLLFGVVVIGLGVAAIGLGVGVLRHGHVLVGIAFIGLGVALIGAGVGTLRHGDVLVGIALIGAGVASTGSGVEGLLSHGDVLIGVAFIGVGIAIIACWVADLRRTGILAHARSWLVVLTKDPGSKALYYDDSNVSGPDDPAPGIHPPTSKPPPPL